VARQNIYDDPTFFAGYRNLRDNLVGLHEIVIRPALPRLLPDDLRGKRVLDLGCGEGWFCDVALERGAASVVGVDPSLSMLSRARERIRDERVQLVQAFAEDVELPGDEFDVVVSVLALHYVADYATVIRSIARWLASPGVFVMFIEHPMGTSQRDLGWIEEHDELVAWPVRDYHREGARTEHWYVDGVVKYHRTVETTLNTLVDAGLILESVIEPAPTQEAVERAGRGASGLIRPDVIGVRATKR
jgi:ubiquinone/menaquinone biosynthesis C-methylase UbiE